MRTFFNFPLSNKIIMWVILSVLASCNKEIVKDEMNQEEIAIDAATSKVHKWLDELKTTASANKLEIIESIMNNINTTQIRFEKLNETEKLIVVPLKATFVSSVNKDKKQLNTLLLIENSAGTIRKGNIVQFTSLDGVVLDKLPPNTFYNFYNSDRSLTDGTYTFLNMSDKILYSMQYQNGKQIIYSQKQQASDLQNSGSILLPTNLSSANSNSSNCSDWYWVQTYYNADGTSYTTATFLYTICNNSDEYIEPEGGGGQGGGEVEEVMADQQRQWEVGSNPSGYWTIYSVEKFGGLKRPSMPGGGYFTSIVHLNEWVINHSNVTHYVWNRGAVTVSRNSSTASSTVSGFLRDSRGENPDVNIPPTTGNFSFGQIFP
jgi:hypothetical protein